MSSEAQIAANQANTQHSTGPNTTAGKAVSSRNRLSHGLAGAFILLNTENKAEYENLLRSLQDEYQPSTATEQLLVTPWHSITGWRSALSTCKAPALIRSLASATCLKNSPSICGTRPRMNGPFINA